MSAAAAAGRANLDALRKMMQEAQEAVMRRNCENEKILSDVRKEHAVIESSFHDLASEREAISDHIAAEIRKDEEQIELQMERERVLDSLLSGFGVVDDDALAAEASTCDGGSRCETPGAANALQDDSIDYCDEPDDAEWGVLENALDASLEAARSQLSSPLVRPQSTRSVKSKQLAEEEEEPPSLSQLLNGLVRDSTQKLVEQPPLSQLDGLVRSSARTNPVPSSPSRAPVDKRHNPAVDAAELKKEVVKSAVASPARGLRNEATRSTTAASPKSQMTLDKLAASQPQFGGELRRSGSGTRRSAETSAQSQSPASAEKLPVAQLLAGGPRTCASRNTVTMPNRISAAAKARGRGPAPALPSSLPRGLL